MTSSLRGRALALAFLTAFVTLFVQILVHRMVSAKLLNNFAFLVISLTMLGFALSGVLLTRLLPRFTESFGDAMSSCAALFTISFLVASIVFYHCNVGPQFAPTRGGFLTTFLFFIPLALLYAIPFTFSGLMLGALLSSPSLPTRRIYFSDLVGSAAGALFVLPAISWLGVETAAILGVAVFLIGAVFLAPPSRWHSRALAGLAAVVVLASLLGRQKAYDMVFPEGSMLAEAKRKGSPMVIEHMAWDPLARIEVSRIPPPTPETMGYPSLIGSNRLFHSRFRRMLTQNNYAFTYAVDYDGRRDSLRGIEETIYAAAYQATSLQGPRVLVIGVGGGFDILNALYFGASSVNAVEINGATVNILRRTYRDYFRSWVEDPRVRLVHGEGRHFLASTGGTYDVIQLSGVDSYSGTPAAAHVFSENFLYTAQAFDLYLSHLTDDGILNMMRLEFNPPREMLRALVSASGALRRAGVQRPADHIVMLTATNGHFTALLVKKTPFTQAEVSRLTSWASSNPFFRVTAAPGGNADRRNMYQAFLSLESPQGEAAFVRIYPFDVSPVDDNRPFFFKYSFWSHIFDSRPGIRASIPVMEYSVLSLLLAVGAAALLCVYVPLRLLSAGGLKAPHSGRYVVYFAGIAVGYLAIEIALLQKFGHFLGHPNYALSVVLAGLLFATGLGSLVSGRTLSVFGELRFVAYALAAVVLLQYFLVLPRLSGWVVLSFATRCLITLSLVMPVGFLLGAFFPTGLERLKETSGAFAPWAWGVNGIFSVLSPIVSVALSMTWGINALLLAALPVYLAAGLVLPTRTAEGTAALSSRSPEPSASC